MIPIPQYPLYSATLDLLGGHKIGYYLDEQSIWGMNVQELERSLAEAKANGVNVVALVLINPGNPTGQVLSGKEVKDIVSFCAKHDIVLLSDEVYQENVYREEDQFFSSRRAADELGLIEVRVLAIYLMYLSHFPNISDSDPLSLHCENLIYFTWSYRTMQFSYVPSTRYLKEYLVNVDNAEDT